MTKLIYPYDTHDTHVYHYNDVIMGAMASQITYLTIVYSTVYSGADQRKHQSSASLAFVLGIHRWLVNSRHKGPVTRKLFPIDNVIMYIKWYLTWLIYPDLAYRETFLVSISTASLETKISARPPMLLQPLHWISPTGQQMLKITNTSTDVCIQIFRPRDETAISRMELLDIGTLPIAREWINE